MRISIPILSMSAYMDSITSKIYEIYRFHFLLHTYVERINVYANNRVETGVRSELPKVD